MRKRTARVNFKLPSWQYCNHQSLWHPYKADRNMCRFCTKTKQGYLCVLDNLPLLQEGELIMKHHICLKGTGDVEIQESCVDTKQVLRVVLDEYRTTYKALVDEGYSHVVADKLAREVVLGHDNKKL